MKKNIRQSKKDGLWWEWEEYCDKCGKQCFNSSVASTRKPDENETDFCLYCLREFVDNDVISCDEAIKRYRQKTV